jgi:hypothetical protein
MKKIIPLLFCALLASATHAMPNLSPEISPRSSKDFSPLLCIQTAKTSPKKPSLEKQRPRSALSTGSSANLSSSQGKKKESYVAHKILFALSKIMHREKAIEYH